MPPFNVFTSFIFFMFVIIHSYKARHRHIPTYTKIDIKTQQVAYTH